MALNYDPTEYTSTQQCNLGATMGFDGDEYLYVKNGASGVAVAGTPAYSMSTTYGEVGKHADTLGGTVALGAYVSAIPAGEYGWILTRGYYAAFVGDTSITAGEVIYSNQDIFDTATIGTHHVLGQAFTDDVSSKFPGILF